jgi:hypothetical protein
MEGVSNCTFFFHSIVDAYNIIQRSWVESEGEVCPENCGTACWRGFYHFMYMNHITSFHRSIASRLFM